MMTLNTRSVYVIQFASSVQNYWILHSRLVCAQVYMVVGLF